MKKLTHIGVRKALALALLSAGTAHAAVTVEKVYSEGYGLKVDAKATVDASTAGTPDIVVPLPFLPPLVIPGTPGLSASASVDTSLLFPRLVAGSNTAGYADSASTLAVGAGISLGGADLLGVLSLLGIGPSIAAVSGTLYGDASYNPVAGPVTGTGGVERLSVALGPVLNLQSAVLQTTSTITIDEANNQVIGGWAPATFVGTQLDVLGLGVDAFVSLFNDPNFNLASVAANTTGSFELDGGVLGLGVGVDLKLDIVLNELLVNGVATPTADCGLGALECTVESNAVHIKLSTALEADALGLLGASVDSETFTEVVIGHSLAYAKIAPVAAIPEPSTYALMLGGLIAVGALARRRKSTDPAASQKH